MTTFTTHTLETASPEGREILEQVQEKYGFIPNLMGNLAEAPTTARAYLSLGDLLGETSFSAAEQQVIMLAVSRYNETLAVEHSPHMSTYAARSSRGNSNWKRVPRCSSLMTWISLPCSSSIRLAMASPRPIEPSLPDSSESAL